MAGSLTCKLGIQQKVEIAEQTGNCRQSQMHMIQAETKPTYLIILILAQTKLICQIIFTAVTTKKLTEEGVKQSQTEYTINLMIFSLV